MNFSLQKINKMQMVTIFLLKMMNSLNIYQSLMKKKLKTI
jgi:hypothetical protein